MEIDKSSAVASMQRGIYLASSFFTKHPAPHYLATGDADRIEIEVGESVEMACPGYLTYQWQLLRKPAGSAAPPGRGAASRRRHARGVRHPCADGWQVVSVPGAVRIHTRSNVRARARVRNSKTQRALMAEPARARND